MNFRFGSFGLVVSRKYAYIILAIIFTLFGVSALTAPEEPIVLAHIEDLPKVLTVSWEDFIAECGSGVYVENSVRANSHFQHTFAANIISWEGAFIEFYDQPENLKNLKKGREYELAVKMLPTDSVFADIMIKVTYDINQSFLATLASLKYFERIAFTATFNALGNERYSHRLTLISITKLSDKDAKPFEEQDM